MDPSSVSTSNSDTDILVLNDDCLLEVFNHLDLTDLVSTADVCRRFRQNAQDHFASPKFKNDTLYIRCLQKLDVFYVPKQNIREAIESRIIHCDEDYSHSNLIRISGLLRNFGAYVKSLSIRDGCMTDKKKHQI